MKKNRKSGQRARSELYFDSRGSHERKARQLCAQVAEAVGLALSATSDPALSGLWVAEVVPNPHLGQLLVRVVAESEQVGAIQAKLTSLCGHFRSEVASAIHRKKTPQLSFAVLQAESPGEER
ncbi:MAG: ribosome-binding factor A [Myxococcota bacterium]